MRTIGRSHQTAIRRLLVLLTTRRRLHTTRKDTQRDRLLRAMTHIAAEEGYAETTVAKIIAEAGVSRPTFYDYSTNREDCFPRHPRYSARSRVDREL